MNAKLWNQVRDEIANSGVTTVKQLIKKFDDEIYNEELWEYEKELRSGILMYRENDIQECLRNFKRNRRG